MQLFYRSQLVRLNFGLSMYRYLDRNVGLRLLLSESLSPSDLLSEITLLFDFSLDLDRTLA